VWCKLFRWWKLENLKLCVLYQYVFKFYFGCFNTFPAYFKPLKDIFRFYSSHRLLKRLMKISRTSLCQFYIKNSWKYPGKNSRFFKVRRWKSYINIERLKSPGTFFWGILISKKKSIEETKKIFERFHFSSFSKCVS
jgi:hypothetical protein